MFLRRFFTVSLLLVSLIANAQESIFYTNPIQNNRVSKFQLEVYNLNFFKNNEYFNKIADGYTLLGAHLHSKLFYNISNKSQIKLGISLSKWGGV